MKRILIIGGGFAGLNLAKRLDKNQYEVMVLDRHNFHCFPPLFYQVASSGLDASNISFPFRREFKKLRNVSYHMGHVKNIDVEEKIVFTSYETLSYDILVIAAGTTNNFFGMQDMEKKVFCMKTVAEASHTRDEILDRLERAAMEKNAEKRRKLLSFLVVGGGPSGVEIAGAIGEMKKDILPREYPELDPDDMNITLVEGSPRVLGSMSEKCSAKAESYLKALMVNVRTGTMVKSYDEKYVTFADGVREYWETVIWNAGVKGEPMPGMPAACIGKGGRIVVDRFNRVKGYEESICALGDIALMTTEKYPHGHPQVAQPAIQQARNLAYNLNRSSWDREFEYNDKGSMATVGKNRAVVDLRHTFFDGWFAWMIWMVIHLVSILGMRNRINVLLNWVWNYLTYSTSLRLLLRPARFPERRHWGD